MKVFFLIIVLFLSQNLFANDLNIEFQLEKLQREVSDLTKIIYNQPSSGNNLEANLSAIDLRIYDLENDMKNMTLNFEELIFQLEDISSKLNEFESYIRIIEELTAKLDELETQMIFIESKVLQNN